MTLDKTTLLFKSSDDNPTQRLIEGCRRNNPKCQEELYKHFFGYALAIAVRYTGDRNKAIEVVDDSFMKVFDKIRLYDKKQDFKGWLRRIVVNTAIDEIRKQQAKSMRERTINGKDIFSNTVNDTDSGIHVSEIYELIKYLPKLHRSVFNLFEIEGYNHKEIADLLQIPESSSRTYLTRAKKELRELYKKYFR